MTGKSIPPLPPTYFRSPGGVMKRRTFSVRPFTWARPALYVLLCAFLFLIPSPARAESPKTDDAGSKGSRPAPETRVEVRFTDNSVLKLSLREDKIDFQTQY